MSGPSAAQAQPGYQPSNQYGADQSFQTGANALMSGGSALQGQTVPGLAQITSNVQNNPYYNTAQAYAGLTSGLAGNTVAPNQFGAGQSQFGSGDSLTGQAGAIGNSGYLGQAQGILGTSLDAGNSILQTGFDPQSALYNRNYQQMLDQTNAINAMNGVSGTPYGAGLAAQSSNNFNLDWQNNQLSREATAASAYGGLVNTGVSGYSGLVGGATGAEANLTNAAGNAYTTGSNLQNAGLQTLTAAGQAQNTTYLQQQQAMMDAIMGQINGTNGAYGLTQQGVADQGQYLGLGQSATQTANQATAANNQTNSNTLSSIGSLLGTAASFIPW